MAVRSLGQLTLDLVARTGGFTGPMSQAQRAAKKDMAGVVKSMRSAATAVTATATAVGAAGTALVAFTKHAADNARELRTQAQLANTSTAEMQRYAYASNTVGIEQEKLADILKDVNDRVGDFLATGGGPMADFFENIAPKVGVTAEEFRKLSGPQALQLYYDSLQKANLSQQDMTFYLEAMASDTTALIPLLRDGGAGFAEMAAEADQLGLVLSEIDLAQLEEFGRQFDRITGILSSMSDVVAAELAPYLSVVADELLEATTNGTDFGDAFSRVLRDIVEGIAPVLDGLDKIGLAAKALRTFAYTMGQAYTAVFAEVVDTATGALDVIAGGINEVISGFNRLPKVDIPLIDSFSDSDYATNVRAMRDELAGLAADARRDLVDSVNAPPPSEGLLEYLDEVDRKRAEIIERIERDQPGTGITLPPSLGGSGGGGSAGGTRETTRELERQAEAYQRLLDKLYPVAAAQRKYAEQMAMLREADAADMVNDLADAQERLSTAHSVDLTGGFMNQTDTGGLSSDDGGYWQQWLEGAEESFAAFDELAGNTIDNFSTQFGNAFESMIFDAESLGEAVYGLADGMARSIVNALGKMAAEWVAYQAVQMALGRSTEAAAIAGATATGSAMASAYAPAAAAASLASFGANSAPAIAGMTAAYTTAEGMSLMGMAHDGIDSVPSEGTWLLDKGERVMTRPQADKLDQFLAQQGGGGGGDVTVNLVEDASRAGQVEQRRGNDGGAMVTAFVASIRGGGPEAQVLEKTYGLKRQGR